jgi:hypothetical protein
MISFGKLIYNYKNRAVHKRETEVEEKSEKVLAHMHT